MYHFYTKSVRRVEGIKTCLKQLKKLKIALKTEKFLSLNMPLNHHFNLPFFQSFFPRKLSLRLNNISSSSLFHLDIFSMPLILARFNVLRCRTFHFACLARLSVCWSGTDILKSINNKFGDFSSRACCCETTRKERVKFLSDVAVFFLCCWQVG